MLLRVPGIGTRSADRIIASRRHGSLRLIDLRRITRAIDKLLPFIETPDWTPGGLTDSANLRARFAPPPEQLSLFA